MKKYVFPGLLLPALLFLSFYRPEGLIDKLEKMLFAYTHEHPVTNLYVHMDKNIYMPGETIWFKAYIASNAPVPSEGLYVRLVDEAQHVVLEREFPVYDVRSHGDITLPDTLAQGTYQLYAYTDKMINFDPHDTFVQQFKIVSNAASLLMAAAYVSDTTVLQPGKKVEVLCSLTSNGNAVKNTKGTYTLERPDGKMVAQGKLTTNVLGNAIISFIYPAVDPLESLKLNARFTGDYNIAHIVLNLPPERRQISLAAYAESGKLVQGVKNKLLIETTDAQGQPVATQIALKNSGAIVAQLTTDRKGHGVMLFTPGRENNYRFTVGKGPSEQIKPFPLEILPTGWTMRLDNTEKSAAMIIHNQGMPQNATLVLRTMDSILWHKPVNIQTGDSLRLALPQTDSIKQILSLALFDDSGKVSNERLFLTRKQENYQVAFQFSKSIYKAREKVKVTLRVTDAYGRPVMSNLSVAGVYQKALDESSYKTIHQSAYQSLNNEHDFFKVFNDQESNFNDLLISKSWWRNSWPAILGYTAKGSIRLIANSAGVTGWVKGRRNKPVKLKEVKNILLFSSSGTKFLQIQPNGSFSIPQTDLLSDGERFNYIFVPNDFSKDYSLEIMNYTENYDLRVKYSGILNSPIDFLTATKPPQPPPISGRNVLKDVYINARHEMDSLTLLKLWRKYPNNCQDYVCEYNILNCKNHLTGVRPSIGRTYRYNGKESYLYTKCLVCCAGVVNNYLLKSIYLPLDFPVPDPSQDASTSEFLATVYWNPNINTNQQGEASFEFYTSDLKGDFKLIVQGLEINTLRAVYGKIGFKVQ